jgi:hypothetical protein
LVKDITFPGGLGNQFLQSKRVAEITWLELIEITKDQDGRIKIGGK